MLRVVFAAFLVFFMLACDKNEAVTPDDSESALSGTGVLTYSGYAPLQDKPIRVFYHIPDDAGADAPILMVFHGNNRDALEARNALVAKSNQLGFITVVPEFSQDDFPGSDAYMLGNIFDDGDAPSDATLNDEESWTFSVIDPLFDFMKAQCGNETSRYDVFGHSAGGQFAHRLVLFKPEAKLNRVMAAASGWYTVPDAQIDFPYGTAKSPLESGGLQAVFSVSMTVMVGAEDTDPNSAALRHTEEADAQGMQRLERAQHFYEESRIIAQASGLPFQWQYTTVANAGHDFNANATAAVNALYR